MHDVVVIGSGFGGAVAACRLSSAGQQVTLLERGRRWQPQDYPRDVTDAWIYDVDEPETQNGWMDLRIFDEMWVAQGAGVGGGSLIYANVSINAPRETFQSGWPKEITYDKLLPYYERVEHMLKPQYLPDNQLTPRFKLMRDAARATRAEDRFRKVPLAVSFNPDSAFPDQQPLPQERRITFQNSFNRDQGYCIHCGNCDIGCQEQAKNTLDLNYLAVAEDHGTTIKPLSVVSHISPIDDYYRVHYDAIVEGRRECKSIDGRKVVLAAGSLGSTEILFRSKIQHRTLPNLSPYLGKGWSSNGDFLTLARYEDRDLFPTRGPTISSAIDYLDGSDGGVRYFVEDGGFPAVLSNVVEARRGANRRLSLQTWVLGFLAKRIRTAAGVDRTMPWFGQAVDASNGRLYFGRDLIRLWKKRLKLDWNPRRSEAAINGLIGRHKILTAATGGKANVPITWRTFRNLITPHPLGGCGMGSSPSVGVVDSKGEVYGYPGLFVVDGAIVPRAIGLNPSKTIAALSELISEGMLDE